MDSEDQQLFEELVGKYSKVYYRRVSSLFDIEELAQEVRLALLQADEADGYEEDQGASKRTYLIACIQNHMAKLIAKEIREKNTVFSGESSTELAIELPTDDLLINKSIADKLKVKVRKFKHGEWVLDKITQGYTVREISTLAEEEGVQLSKSGVSKVVQKIKNAYYFASGE